MRAGDAASGRWPVWALALYPFAAGAVAIDVFFVGLMAQAVDAPAIGPVASLALGGVLGAPAGWLSGRWVRRLMDEADAGG